MPDDGRTRRWQRSSTYQTGGFPVSDIISVVRQAIAAVRAAPRDLEVRRQLRAVAAAQGMVEQVALLLLDEARANSHRPEIALAFWEEIADVNENLDQPLEVIAAMEHVIALVPEDIDQLDRLAWLYRKAGAWQKAAETFERVGTIAQDERARASMRAAGTLYRENGRNEKAAAVYRRLVEKRPNDAEAWRHLDELLGELGQWEELARVRSQRAQRATSGVEKAALLRAQARALEQAGDLHSAAQVVKTAANHAPDDVSGLVDYADVLARSGQLREAAEILRQRVDEAIERGAATNDVAALRLRLGGILEESGDAPAARAVLDELLASAPEYVPALERATALAASDPDPRVHAQALLRYAAALPDEADRTIYIVMAGRRYAEAGEHAAAVRQFEQATQWAPHDEEVRAELLEARTAGVVESAAANAQDESGASERRLREILQSQPHHVGANLAFADILVASRRQEAAAVHLRETLSASPEDMEPSDVARLVLRLAHVMEELGDSDEAHQLLHDAHRLDRRSLPITLALGESCFSRKLWRQAALHLSAASDHPDAPRYPRQVAVGLVHAAQAETRALRPGNAMKHFEAAVRLDPSCGAAWHALAEDAIAKGELVQAADYLEHEASSTTSAKDRLRLFDALGDMAMDVLGDRERAERCWLTIAAEPGASAEMLQKLRATLRERGATTELGETDVRLAALQQESIQKKPLHEEAAIAFAKGGDFARAMQLAEELIQRYPRDPRAVDAATTAAAAAGDAKRVVAWLRAALAAWDNAAAKGDPVHKIDLAVRAGLFRKLGDAMRDLDDEAGALTAYQRAVDASPQSEAAMAARRGLVELASSTGRNQHSSIIALVEAAHDPFDVIAWARSAVRSGDVDEARAAYELARAIGARLTPDDEKFIATHPPHAMASDEGYSQALSTDDRVALIDGHGDPQDAAAAELGGVFALLAEALPLLVPSAQNALVDANILDAKRIPAQSDAAVIAMYPQIVKALHGPPTLLFHSPRAQKDVQLLLAQPPVVVIGPRLLSTRAGSRSDIDFAGDGRLRYELGRIVELSRPTRIFAGGQDADAFENFVAELRTDKFRTKLPVALRPKLADRLAKLPAGALDAETYRSACLRAADRAGLLVCGDVNLAIELAGGAAAAPHLVRLAANRRYLAARQKLRARSADDTSPFSR
ncbi:MAG TPA: tetratricopeptide repeat protein [Kofleriaceae bacterium]|jgi:tetratricopeptide (TPR) repeat protein